ncbi:MAG: TIR domain-containing protein [Pseudomonadota bacterium]
MTKMARLFISHSSADNSHAEGFAEWLTANGWDDYFLDFERGKGLNPGERWQEALKAAADRCEAVVFLISPSWRDSKWCLAEFLLAKQLGKSIFGVVVEPTPLDSLPLEMSVEWQLADFTKDEEEGKARLKLGLEKAGLAPSTFPWPPASDPNRAPYRGLKPLESEDAAVMFGRDADIIRGLDAFRRIREIGDARLMIIRSASGAGKSSFLRAGLWPRLRRDNRHFLPLPIIRPGRQALTGETGLAAALEGALAQFGVSESRGSIANQIQQKQDRALQDYLMRLQSAARLPFAHHENAPPTILIAFDQAEELVHSEGDGEAQLVLKTIAPLISERNEDATENTLMLRRLLRVAATVRSDSYDLFRNVPEFEFVKHTSFDLNPIMSGSFREIILGPAMRASEVGQSLEIRPDLVDALLGETTGPDALPLLAFTLERLFVQYGRTGVLHLQEYKKLGGVRGSIEAAIAEALERPNADTQLVQSTQEELLRSAFLPWLVKIDSADGAPLRRVAAMSDIPKSARPLVTRLIDKHLLRSATANGAATVEVAHEALLRSWSTLAIWIEEERSSLRILSDVQTAAQSWAERLEIGPRNVNWLIHRGDRLEYAEKVLAAPHYQKALGDQGREYLLACRAQHQAAIEEKESRLAEIEKNQKRSARLQAALWVLGFALMIGTIFVAAASFQGLRQTSRVESMILTQAAQTAVANRDFDRALRYSIIATTESVLESTTPESEASLRDIAIRSQTLPSFFGHTDKVSGMVSAEDGSTMLSWSEDNTVRVWDRATTNQIGKNLAHQQDVQGAMFSRNAERILSWTDDGELRLWSTDSGKQLGHTLRSDYDIIDASLSMDGTRILAVGRDRQLRLWDADASGRLDHQMTTFGKVDGAVFSEDSSKILSWASGRSSLQIRSPSASLPIGQYSVHTWDAESGDLTNIFWFSNGEPVEGSAFSKDASHALAWGALGSIRVWNLSTTHRPFPTEADVTFSGHERRPIVGAMFSENNRRALSWGEDETLRLWDTATGAQLGATMRHESSVEGAVFSKDERRILSWSLDYSLRVWDADTGLQIGGSMMHNGAIKGASFSEDENYILSWGHDATVRLWDADRATQIGNSVVRKSSANGAELSKDARRIIHWGDESEIRVSATPINFRTRYSLDQSVKGATLSNENSNLIIWGNEQISMRQTTSSDAPDIVQFEQDGPLDGVVLSRDESLFATFGGDKVIRVWDAVSGDQIGTDIEHRDPISGASFSKDGTRIITWSTDGSIRIWDLLVGRLLNEDLSHSGPVIRAEYSRDESHIISWANDNSIRRWNTRSGESVLINVAQDGIVLGANIHPDKTRIVLWSEDLSSSNGGSLAVWDVESGRSIGQKILTSDRIQGAKFSRTGDRIVYWTRNYEIYVIDAKSLDQIGDVHLHDRAISDAFLASDGNSLFFWGGDNKIHLFDIASKQKIGHDFKHDNIVFGAELSRDESHLVSWSMVNSVYVWDIDWFIKTETSRDLIKDVCESSLSRHAVRATAGYTDQSRDNRGATVYRGQRRISELDIERAPILQGRLGEDVCNPSRGWRIFRFLN